MKKIGLFLLLGFSLSWLVSACQGCQQERRKEVPLDSIVLSDPCILADRKSTRLNSSHPTTSRMPSSA